MVTDDRAALRGPRPSTAENFPPRRFSLRSFYAINPKVKAGLEMKDTAWGWSVDRGPKAVS